MEQVSVGLSLSFHSKTRVFDEVSKKVKKVKIKGNCRIQR